MEIAPALLSDLGKLQTLNLRTNQLNLLEDGSFDSLVDLINLDISDNKIEVKYTNPAYQHSHFCKQKLTAPPSVSKCV